MQRLKDESGAVAVIVAIVMTVLIGFAALAVDASAMWAEKRQLQNGADAGALAIAQACAKGACGDTDGTAQSFAEANKNDGSADGEVLLLLPSNKVTVQVSDPHDHWFKQGDTEVAAKATATWGSPVKSGGAFPLTFSYCEWEDQADLSSTDPQTIVLSKHSGSDCTGPNGLPLPGGFGWVKPNAGSCTESTTIGGWYSSDTGNSPPSGCSASDFDKLIGTTILIPIFDKTNDLGGNNGEYQIYAYAAFVFLDYDFQGTYKGKGTMKDCKNPDRCVSGYFTRYVDLNEVLEVGPSPDLGLSIVTLES